MDLDDNEDNDDDTYKDNASYGDDDDDVNDEAWGEANAPPEDENLRWVHLLAGVIRTNQDYGLGPMVPLLDASVAALAAFKAVELQTPTFFASRLLMCAGGLSEVDLPISFRCLQWNLMAPFLQCNRVGWTGCGRFS
jgi:hypothetical protein